MIRDETCPRFELVQRCGPASKGSEWGPTETIIRRIDGRTGIVLSQNRTWGRPKPLPDVVFGWKGDFVLYDHEGVLLRGADVLRNSTFVNPTERILEFMSFNAARREASVQSVDVSGELICLYPRPLFGPKGLTVDGPFKIGALKPDDMVVEGIVIPDPADELDVFGELIVSRRRGLLTGYSLHGERMWQVPAVSDEHLSLHKPWQIRDRLLIDSNLFVTTRESFGRRKASVVVRHAADGTIAWQKDLDGIVPERALAIGPYVVLVGSRKYPIIIQEQPGSRYESHWWVWGRSGNEIATGIEPLWKAEYAFRGGAAATRVGVAFDEKRSSLVIGAGLDAVSIRDGKLVGRLSSIPGEPLFLDDNVLVCHGETSHFAVRLEPEP